MNFKNIMARGACCGVVAALALAACSDFSDYNEAPVDSTPSGNQSLWENILQNGQLTNFAELIKRTGFDAELSSPRSFTVWAPADGSFNMADYQGLSNEDLLFKFVKSHVAEYNHAASGNVDERIHALNEKSFSFSGNGSYAYDGVGITQSNLPSNNGLMHIINGVAQFYPNLYEYITTASGIDSLQAHFLRYEQTRLDEQASVIGPMVDGVQTYIDSVMVTTNSLTNQLNARLANEDSSYTFILPTDEAFMKMYNRVAPLYNFITTTKVQDVENYTSATDNSKTKSVTVDAAYMRDSLTRRAIMRNLVFSNTDMYNKWVVNKGLYTDTLRSTTRTKLSNPREILEKYAVGEPIEMSNGYGRLVDSLAYHPWETFCPELRINPAGWMASLFPPAAQGRLQTMPDTVAARMYGPDAINYSTRYLWISPGGDRTKPDFYVELPEVMSTTYNFYVVFLPSAWREIANDPRPNLLNFQLSYTKEDGNTANYNFSKACADSLLTGGPLPKEPASVSSNTAFTNHPEKADTVFIGQFTFPVNYSGLGSYYPSLHITSPISVFSSQQLETYTRDVRIAMILMRPVELDEYLAKNK